MKIYFPQWQGSGTGQSIENGARFLYDQLNDDSFVEIPLTDTDISTIKTNEHGVKHAADIAEQLERFRNHLMQHQPEKLQTIGGDCGLEIVPVTYLNEKYANLAIIWFDAHADINRACDSPSCNFHGMPLRTMLGEADCGLEHLLFSRIKPSQIHYVGLRDIDQTEQLRIDQDGIYAPKKLDVKALVATLKAKNIENIYLHFDVDGLDPKSYKHTYYQVDNGVTIESSVEMIQSLQSNFNVVGTSLLESVALKDEDLAPIQEIIELLLGNDI